MPRPIAIFYHGLFFGGDPPARLPAAVHIIGEQMHWLKTCGVMRHCSEMHSGFNGGLESAELIENLVIEKSHKLLHGLQCKSELRTLLALELWLLNHPGWNVLYLHSKGATHPVGHDMSTRWRNCMMRNLVSNWEGCLSQVGERLRLGRMPLDDAAADPARPEHLGRELLVGHVGLPAHAAEPDGNPAGKAVWN